MSASGTLKWAAPATALALLLAGCSSYHALPLPERPNLTSSLAGLNLQLPPTAPGAAPVTLDPSRPLTPDQVGLLAIANDPDLVAERAKIGVAKADWLSATILPNPSVSAGYAWLLGGPGTTDSFTASISQDIRSILTYQDTVDAAKSRYRAVNADLMWQEWQAAQKARLLAVDIYDDDRTIALRERELGFLSKELKEVHSATEAGNLDLTAEAPLRASEASAEIDLESAKLARLKDWQDLDAILGLRPGARFAVATPEPMALPDDLDHAIATLPVRRPDLVALRLGYQAADTDVRAAILGQFPAFSLGFGGGSDTSSVSSAGPLFTFDLPIFDRNQGKIASARATRVELRAEYQARLDEAEGTARSLIERRAALEADLARAQKAARAAADLSDSAQRAYAAGNLGQRELTDYQTTALDRELDVADDERTLEESSLALFVELGLGLPSVTLALPDQVKEP
ncbi:MAG TPA: TolC family protein [Alphaproteobacteria bacterium]|nr:TolC family protein [Alphaproteobacteria bacterium]